MYGMCFSLFGSFIYSKFMQFLATVRNWKSLNNYVLLIYSERRNLCGSKMSAILCDHKPITQNKFHIYLSIAHKVDGSALLSHKLILHK